MKYGRVPEWWASLDLPVRAFRTGVALWSYANSFGHAWPSISSLCKTTSLDRRTVQRALDDLVERNLLCIKAGNAKSTNHYWLSLLPDEPALTIKREKRVWAPEPIRVWGLDEGEGMGSGTHLTTKELPIRTPGDLQERGEDGLTNEERVDAFIAANVVDDPDTQPGDDFLAGARKRWPARFKATA